MMTVTNRKRRCESCGFLFVPEHDTATVKQVVCSHSCCVVYYDKQKPKSKKLARLVAQMVGKRSMGEVTFYANSIEPAEDSIEDGKFIAEYEPESFEYSVNEKRTYTPDFKIILKKRASSKKPRKVFYIEFKGVLDLETRKKMLYVKQEHPKLDIRFVFQRPTNKIRKDSKTTYGMWATKNGFKWADNCIPEEWLK